jgi:hypothetical protein
MDYASITSFDLKIYTTVILLAVLCGCETWSVTFREEYRLRVFEKRVLREIFGPKKEQGRGEWRRLHNESFMICTPHQIFGPYS